MGERVICCIYHSKSRFVLKMNNKTIAIIFFFSVSTIHCCCAFHLRPGLNLNLH